jgi:hypothetical protein
MFGNVADLPEPDQQGEYFFDRNGRLFEVVLDFYRIGRLRIPPDTPLDLLVDELDFFRIDYSELLSDSTPSSISSSVAASPLGKKLRRAAKKPRRRYDDDGDDDDDDEDDDDEEEEEIPDEWQIARGQGEEAMFRLATHKIWASAASRHDVRGGRALLLEIVAASQVYKESDAKRAAASRRPPPAAVEPLSSAEAAESVDAVDAVAELLEPEEPADVPTNIERMLFPIALASWRIGDTAAMQLWLNRAQAAHGISEDTSNAVRTLRLVTNDLRDSGVKVTIMVSVVAIAVGFLVARFSSHRA